MWDTGRKFVALPLTILAFALIFQVQTITLQMIGVWVLAFLMYVLADFLTHQDRRFSPPYCNIPVLLAWLTLGPGFALLTLIGGALTAAGLRWRVRGRRPFQRAGERISIYGVALILSALIYQTHPLNLTDANNILLLALAFFVNWLVVEFPRIRYRSRFVLIDTAMTLATLPLALVYAEAGFYAFAVVMVLVLSHFVRQHQIRLERERVLQRVNHLSLAESTSLDMDSVLEGVYRHVHRLVESSLFYIALYKPDFVNFHYVMHKGKRLDWPPHFLFANSLFNPLALNQQVQTFLRKQDTAELFAGLPDDPQHQVYVGVPLTNGDETIGLMALVVGKFSDILNPIGMKTLETIATQSSLAIRNALLYERSTRLADNLKYVNQSIQDVMFNLDGAEALRIACETALKISSAQRSAVFLIDQESKNQVRLAHQVNLTPEHQALYTGPIHLPPIKDVEPRIISNIANLPERDVLVDLAEAGRFQAMAEIPLTSGSAPVGMLAIFHDLPHHFDATELELLETLAYQITAAIDYTDLLNALELYAAEQAQLVQLSRISTSSLDLTQVMENVTKTLKQMLNVQQVEIGFVQQGQVDFNNSRPVTIHTLPEIAELIEDLYLGPRLYQNHTSSISPQLRQFMDERAAQSVIFVPLLVSNAISGMIVLSTPDTYLFPDNERRLLEMSTNLLATQLHNARLYQQTQAALERRLQQLTLIEEIARQISGSLDLDRIIFNVLEAAIRATQADTASIGLVTETGNFRVITQELYDGAWYNSERMREQSAGLMGRVLQAGTILIVPDNRTYEEYIYLETAHQSYLSSLIVPLISDGNVIGVLNVESVHQDFFNEEHLHFVRNLSGHAVISIQNASLLKEREDQINTLQDLRELSLWLVSEPDKYSVAQGIVQSAMDLVQGNHAGLFHYDDRQNALSYLAGPEHLFLGVQTQILQATQNGEIISFENAVEQQTLVVAPIQRGEQVNEVLCMLLSQPRLYLKAALNKLELLTIQAAGHLENAILYEQIRTSRDRIQAILDSSRDGIIMLDRVGHLVEANLSAEHLLNIHLQDYTYQNFADTLLRNLDASEGGENQSVREALTEMARILRLEPERISRRSFSIEVHDQTKYIEEVGSPVLDSAHQIIGRLLTLRDVTEEKLLESFRDEISNMVVHDLRGPLGSIISSITLTQEIIGETNDPALTDMIIPIMDVSLDSAVRLLRLVDSLLDIARLETRLMPIDRRPIAPADLVISAASALGLSIQDANVTLEQVIAPDLPQVDVDEDKIQRVIINLLDNAIRFTPTGSVIQIKASYSGNKKVVIRVADSGPGIPPSEVNRVFEKFRQIKGYKPNTGRKGTGLGLTFCKLAVEAHGETIWIEQNGPLPGACFAFTLPVVSAEYEALPSEISSREV